MTTCVIAIEGNQIILGHDTQTTSNYVGEYKDKSLNLNGKLCGGLFVEETGDNFYATGSGLCFAKAAFEALRGVKIPLFNKVKIAVETAMKLDPYSGGKAIIKKYAVKDLN